MRSHAPNELETPSGARVAATRLAGGERWPIALERGSACLICLDGVGMLSESGGTFLVKPGFMAVRPAPWRGAVDAGPAPMRLVLFAWSPRAMAALGDIALGVASSRTLYGRGSIEIAWRAAGELRVGDPYTPRALDFYAQGVALSLTRFAAHDQGVPSPRAARARRLLERRLTTPLDLSALAREVGCAPAYLSRLFRRTYGVSPAEYLIRRRVERSRTMLSGTQRSIAEIAGALGFHDASHFARHFRRLAGVSPREFRARQHEVNPVPE